MSDLIERLRDFDTEFEYSNRVRGVTMSLCDEAADEIERLEAELKASRSCRGTQDEQIYWLNARIEKLEAVVECYARHERDCQCQTFDYEKWEAEHARNKFCDCGLAAALREIVK